MGGIRNFDVHQMFPIKFDTWYHCIALACTCLVLWANLRNRYLSGPFFSLLLARPLWAAWASITPPRDDGSRGGLEWRERERKRKKAPSALARTFCTSDKLLRKFPPKHTSERLSRVGSGWRGLSAQPTILETDVEISSRCGTGATGQDCKYAESDWT